MKVTALTARAEPSEWQTAQPPRQFDAVDELAAQLGAALSIDVPVIEGSLADAPPDGYLLVFDLGLELPTGMGPRIVAFNEDRSTIMESVETHDLAAAIETHRYFEWRTKRAAERGYGLVGRKDVAPRMNARVTTGPYTSARYALLASDSAANLVELLAAYLTAYAQVVAIP